MHQCFVEVEHKHLLIRLLFESALRQTYIHRLLDVRAVLQLLNCLLQMVILTGNLLLTVLFVKPDVNPALLKVFFKSGVCLLDTPTVKIHLQSTHMPDWRKTFEVVSSPIAKELLAFLHTVTGVL